jgi:hypothetical protein
MRSILVDLLHIFVMLVILGFGVACLFASAGSFDHWNKRLKGRRRYQ